MFRPNTYEFSSAEYWLEEYWTGREASILLLFKNQQYKNKTNQHQKKEEKKRKPIESEVSESNLHSAADHK